MSLAKLQIKCVCLCVCVGEKIGYCVQISAEQGWMEAWLCVRSTEIIVSHKFCVLRLNLILVGQPQCQLKRPTSQSPSINFFLVLFFVFFSFSFFFAHCIRVLFCVGKSEKLWQGIVPKLCMLLLLFLLLLLLSCVVLYVCACVCVLCVCGKHNL